MIQNAFLFRSSNYGGVISKTQPRHIELPKALKEFVPMTFRNNIATPPMDSARGTLTLDNYRKTPDTVAPSAVSFRFNLPVISDINDAKTAGRAVRTVEALVNVGLLNSLNFEHLMAVAEQLRNMPISPARELFGSTLYKILSDLSATPSGSSRGREIGAALTMLRTSVPGFTNFMALPPTGILTAPPVPALYPPAPAFTPPVGPGVMPVSASAPAPPVIAASPNFQDVLDSIDLLDASVDQKSSELTDIIDFMDNTPVASERDAVLNKLRTTLSSLGYDVDADSRLDIAPLVVSADPEVILSTSLQTFLKDKTFTDGEVKNLYKLADDITDVDKKDEAIKILGELEKALPILEAIRDLKNADAKDPDFIKITDYIDNLPDDGVKQGLTEELKLKIDDLSGAPLLVSAQPPAPSGPVPVASVPTVKEERYTLKELVDLQTNDNKRWIAFLKSFDPKGMYYSEPRSRIGQNPSDAKRGDYIARWVDPTNRDLTADKYKKSLENKISSYKKRVPKFIDPDGVYSSTLGYIHGPSF